MKNSIKLTEQASQSYKIGVDEIVGLSEAIFAALLPVKNQLKTMIYWDDLKMTPVEYKRRDGFIPHSHNCGGLELGVILPKCEEYEFDHLVDFGDHDDDCELMTKGEECSCGEQDGHLDAFLRIRLKFEGIQKDGSLQFYLFAEGGNHDAPYFRNTPTVFEAEFSAKSVAGVKRAASKSVAKLIKLIKGA